MDTSALNPASSSPSGVPPITEADLHAFVDEQLAPARRKEVEAFLATHPSERERVDDWLAQNAMLRQYLDPVLTEPLPLRLPIAMRRTVWPWRAMAAGVAIAVISSSSAWWLRGVADGAEAAPSSLAGAKGAPAATAAVRASTQALPGFAQRAAVAHAVYSVDQRRPVEVAGDQEQALVTWLTKRMGAPVRAPDLNSLGYGLLGGRLLPGDKAPVAQFMYGDAQGQRLTLYVTREDAGRETAFSFGQNGAVNLFYWVDKDFGYALSGNLDRPALTQVADVVYQQLEARSR